MKDSPRDFDPSDRLLEIAEEFAQAVRAGHSPTMDDYATRYPDIADEITRYFPLLICMEDATVRGASQTQNDETNLPIPVDKLPVGISRYHVRELVGQGAMGAVYKAHDLDLDRIVALKMPQWRHTDRDAVDRFYREARAMATLDHRNICSIYDVGEVDADDVDNEELERLVGRPYLTMAFIEGTDLSDLMKERSWTTTEAAEFALKVASALQAAHEAGVVHRDIKPGNIVIDQYGEPIVMDFGLARRNLSEEVDITLDGQMIGSPAYMSPEQINCQRRLGPSTDIYSLGVVFYELVCGRRPFSGSRLTLLRDVCWTQPPSPKDFRNDLDSGVEAISMKAIAKEPSERYVSAKQFADDLRTYLRAAPDSQLVAPRVRKRGSRTLGLYALVAACGLLVAAAASWPMWGSSLLGDGENGGGGQGTPVVTSVDETPTHSTEVKQQFRHRIDFALSEFFKQRDFKSRLPNVAQSFSAAFEALGVTEETTLASDLEQMLASPQFNDVKADIFVGLEGWLACSTRTEDVPEEWLHLLLKSNQSANTPLRSALLEMDLEKLDLITKQYNLENCDPRLVVVWNRYLRNIEHGLGKSSRAVVRQMAAEFLKRAHETHADDPWVSAALGLRMKENGSHLRAIALFEAAGKRIPSPGLFVHQSMCHLNKKQYEEAIACLAQAEKLSADYGMVDLMHGKTLYAQGDWHSAEIEFRDAVAKDCSNLPLALRYLARSLRQQIMAEDDTTSCGQDVVVHPAEASDDEKHDQAMAATMQAVELHREKEQWSNVIQTSQWMLNNLEQQDEHARVHHRFQLVQVFHEAAVRLNQVNRVKPYAKRVLDDLSGVESPDSPRAKKLKRILGQQRRRN